MYVNSKNAKRLITFMVVGFVFAIFASNASAECGPGFSSKSQLIQIVKHSPSIAHGMRKELLAESRSEYQADETVLNYLREANQQVFKAPSDYVLSTNTYCPGGPGDYQPYGGLLNNMPGKPMLWHCDKDGNNCVPLLKGYCMNFVTGHSVRKHQPKHVCHKCRKPPKCACKKHHKPKPKPSCEAQGLVTVSGNCVKQTNEAEQNCKATVNGTWNGNQCTIVQINNNCGNVAIGNEAPVSQGGNCYTTVIEKPCSCKPPCECTPEEPKVKPEIIPEKTQEFELNETTKEAPICARAHPGAGTTITAVYLEAEYGHVVTPKSYSIPGEKFCNETYKAPSVLPPFHCTESGLDPSAEWCDILTWTAEASNGTKVSVTKQVPIIEEHPF